MSRCSDEQGGWKAADTTLWREHLHAATVVGRMAGARRAVELGYAIEADNGSSGRLGHWRIAGIPVEAEELFSRRAAEIDAAVAERGTDTYQARQIAARTTRDSKRFTPISDLMTRWQAELASIGLDAEELARRVDTAAAAVEPPAAVVSLFEVRPALDALVAPEGPLARRKVFARRDVLVALAPALYGQDPSQLQRYADWLLTKPDIVPLVGVAGARERAYALASVIAVEAAIADAVLNGVRSTGAALVADDLVDAAVTRREAQLGGPLTEGQEALIRGVCSSGRRVELVLGVAGSGKTTALAGVRDAYQAAGYHVVGTATSGQAARTLGREAGIAESRTVASLLWRLDQGQLNLNNRTLVVLDEAGMTPDGDLLRLLIAANAAEAKVILVGDDRQLGPVGPGGALSGLLERAPDAVHVLDRNIRQHHPGERRALEQLRAGDIGVAVDWYVANGRLRTASTRDETLNNLVNAWLNDQCSGLNSGLYAWRRANVAALNTRARAAWAAAGRLTGPELHAPGGRRYAAGDRIVTLAPAADGAIVTSQRGVVERVDLDAGRLWVRMDDGQLQTLEGNELGVDRLDHGYATTVHRAQGATVDVAHRLHDGGGRELAYVAMSRARHHTTIHVVADDLAQAVEDLQRDWRDEHRPRWAIDTGTPTTHPLAAEHDPDTPTQLRASLRKARLQAERQAIAALIPPDPTPMLLNINHQIDETRQQLHDLQHGTGQYKNTDIGVAAQRLSETQRCRALAEQALSSPELRWRDRRRWRREAAALAHNEQSATTAWEHASQPERLELTARLQDLYVRANTMEERADVRTIQIAAHPALRLRLERLDHELAPETPAASSNLIRRPGCAQSAEAGLSAGEGHSI